MLNILKKITLLFLISVFFTISSEASWITKKSEKTEKTIKEEKKQKSDWIKLKKKQIKKDKADFKKEEKEITKEVKSWITKKAKTDYIKNIDELPNDSIYFTGSNESKNILIYGYVKPDYNSKLIQGFHETSIGFGYFNDGKTTCKIGSTVIDVFDGEITARVSGECSNGIKFTGKTSQNKDSGIGFAKTSDGKNRFLFDFNTQKKEIAKLFDQYKKFEQNIDSLVERKLPQKNKKKILLDPKGKYYALLIGNSKYTNGWDSLISPVNDIRDIKNSLEKNFKFEKILTVENGTKREIYDAFAKLSNLTTTNDFVLVYYSGHGQIKAQQAYWIPVDGSPNWGSGDWINISEIDIFLTEIKAHHLAVLVDSCFVGSKFKGLNLIEDVTIPDENNFEKYLQSSISLRSRSVLSSGTTGQVSDTVKGTNNSRFALSIINNLNVYTRKAYPLTLDELSQNMKFTYTKFQKPMYYNPDSWKHGGGTFTFIPKSNLK